MGDAMNIRPKPAVLYKYCPAPYSAHQDYCKLMKRIKVMICDRKVYFAKPSEFNDPFDSKMDSLLFNVRNAG